jgi:hypothetical protein
LISSGEQLEQAFTAAAHRHGVGAVFIGGRGNTTDGPEDADGDVAGFDQLGRYGAATVRTPVNSLVLARRYWHN